MITKEKHFTETKHTIFKEANPWKLNILAFWAKLKIVAFWAKLKIVVILKHSTADVKGL